MIEGAIFDMDGVLLNNLSFHVDAWKGLGRELGRALAESDVRAVFGQRNQEMLRALIGLNFATEEAERHGERKEEIYRSLIKPHLPNAMVPGLVGFLNDLRDQQVRIALATSGTIDNVDFVLDHLELVTHFEVVLTGADVEQGKPHPDIFQLATERFRLAPRQCVVFEDSLAGVEAALRAGCFCIGVSTTHNFAELREIGAHHIIRDFKSISVDILRKLGARWSGSN